MIHKELDSKKGIDSPQFNLIKYIKVYFDIILKKLFIYIKQKKNSLLCRLGYPINNNPNSFEDLTPVIITDGDIYIDSLFWALRNKNIKNIALTGSYGSGKSSILKTFKEKHSEFEYLNISLATFDDLFEKDDKKIKSGVIPNSSVPNKIEPSKSEEVNKKIELSILQQMLYVEKRSTIPNSRFQRIRNLKSHSILIYSLFCLITVLSYIFLFHNNLITKLTCIKYYFFESEYCELNFKFFEVLSILFLLFGAFYIIKGFVKTVGDFKFNKINLKGEVELNREVTDNSILNRNIDEIIYFFERTKYNVVIIEDLDRFKEPEIFTKLREINLLINLSKQVNRHIVFIYALKDEMFKNSDRTKFFDFILPIIPVINSSNSYNFLLEKFVNEVNKGDEKGKIDTNLLYDISLYIDDMRLLKNIVNEYKIYYDKLTKETQIELVPNKLLSFIIYKNLFPKDFAKLHKNEGMVYDVFNIDITNIKLKLSEDEESKIKENNIELKRIKQLVYDKTRINDVKDLRKLYIFELLKLLPNETVGIQINEEFCYLNQIEKLIQEDIFDEIRKANVIFYSEKILDRFRSTIIDKTTEFKINFNEIEKKVDKNYNYEERISLIFDGEYLEIEKLKNEIHSSKLQIEEIKANTVKQILSKTNCQNLLNDKIQKSDVLIYFINNEYIAEDYFDYISIFKEGDITRNDKNFILSIRNNKDLPIDYRLNKIDNILKYLKNDYHKNSILNIYFMDHLLKDDYYDNYELFNQFCDKNERVKLFIESYFKNGKKIENFVKLICKYDLEFWYYIESSNLVINEKDNILKALLTNVSLLKINSQNQMDKLTGYISQKDDFLNLFNYESKIVENNLLILNVKFQFPLDYNENKNLFDFIYENNLYQLNFEMLKQVIEIKSDNNILLGGDFEKTNYSSILNSNCSLLIKYINSNINTYVNNVYLEIEQNLYDEEKILKKLLNNVDLEYDLIVSIIKKVETIFLSFDNIDDIEIDKLLLINNKITPNWKNIFIYFAKCNNTLDENLVKFLNFESVYTALSNEKMKQKDENFEYLLLRTEILKSNLITDNSYINLFKNSIYTRGTIDFVGLSEVKINYLVKNILITNKLNYDFLRINYPEKQIALIENDFNSFFNNIADFDTNEKEIYQILNSINIDINNKFKFISKLTEQQIVQSEEVSKKIGEVIILMSTKIDMEIETLSIIFNSLDTIENKIKIINLYFRDISDQNIISFVKSINFEYKKIFEKGKPTFKNVDYNKRLFSNMKEKKLIKNFYDDFWSKDKIRVTTNY